MITPDRTFQGWPKLSRLYRDVVLTEKLDGSNSAVCITENDIYAQSRTRVITPGKDTDNYGFAAWVEANAETLRDDLGVGRHFGEFWGGGIQRNYGLHKDDKRFSLFNTSLWYPPLDPEKPYFHTPNLRVVPVLYEGIFSENEIQAQLNLLRAFGSVAAPGFPKPEGVVVFHTASNTMYKITLENDEVPKTLAKEKL